jgi:hypothetical protein
MVTMERFLLPLLVSCVLVLSSSSVLAYPIEIAISPQEQAGDLYSVMKFRMTLINNQNFDDTLQVVFSGPHLEWNLPTMIAKEVPAHSSADADIVFYPTGTSRGRFGFVADAYSLSSPGLKSSADFSIEIPQRFILKGFAASASGGEVNMDAQIQSSQEITLEGVFVVKDSSGRTLGRVPFRESVSGEKAISAKWVPSQPLISGAYVAVFSAEGVTREATFSILPSRSLSQQTEESFGLFGKEVLISITNEGNVVERDYRVMKEEPIDLMTGLLTKPDGNCGREGEAMECSFIVSEIKPGTTAYVSYSVSYWPAFNGYLVVAIITVGLIVYSFIRVTTPRITKHHSRKGDGKHSISIHIRNPLFHRLNDVVVKDWVSPLAQVLHEEIESTKPVIRKLEDGGTELIWKLGEVKPREERILQYKVRSLVSGSLRMPGAHLKFNTGKDPKKIKLESNNVTLG